MVDFRIARMLSRTLRTIAQIVACLLLLVLFVCSMIVIQGRRDETRPAGIALVVDAHRGPEDGLAQAELEQALALAREGTVARIVLPGDAQAAESQRYLISRGAPAEIILTTTAATDLPGRIAASANTIRASGTRSVVVVARPESMLRVLKIARDQGLDTYGSPVSLQTRGRSVLDILRDTLRESWAYLTYVFFGS
jgi:uncharacterized SAM-binding protein YcdF (DUF218 family)